LLFIFIAALTGSLLSLPLLAGGRLKRTSTIPFGPFLIAGLIIVQLFGAGILHWYARTLL
jgi:leader peptidase (prepilin peptidase) / N-methyltransferase